MSKLDLFQYNRLDFHLKQRRNQESMVIIRLILFLFILLYPALLFPNQPNVKIRYFKRYYFQEESRDILDKIEILVKKNEKLIEKLKYLKSFWRVYYLNDKVIGEEYYKNWRLHYYYLYYYSKKRTHKRGFFWHGITAKAFFHIEKRYIWQGYFYKRGPDVWWIYDHEGKLITKAYYTWLDREKIDYTDRYFYKNRKLIKIERYRDGILTKTYHIK